MSAAKKETVKTNQPKITTKSLHTWNVRIAALAILQAVIIIIFGSSYSIPITIGYLGVDTLQSQAQGKTVLAAASHQLFSINLLYVVVLLFVVLAVMHGLLATKLRPMYEREIKKGVNRVRWCGFAVSMGLILVTVALLSGVYDLASLLMLFILGVGMNLVGLILETTSQGARKPNWFAYVVMCVAGFVPWVVFAMYALAAHIYGSGVPAYVHWVYLSVFIVLAGIAVNTYLLFRKEGRWADYLYGEQVYMALGFIATVLLTWQVFAGSLRP